MIPLRDDTPRFTTPFVTYFLLALNIAVFLFELSLDESSRTAFFFQFGIVPVHVTGALTAGAVGTGFFPLLTSMFLHGGWLHLIANMWVLWIFGDNIEDYFGHFRFLLFYITAGLAAGLMHIALNLGSNRA